MSLEIIFVGDGFKVDLYNYAIGVVQVIPINEVVNLDSNLMPMPWDGSIMFRVTTEEGVAINNITNDFDYNPISGVGLNFSEVDNTYWISDDLRDDNFTSGTLVTVGVETFGGGGGGGGGDLASPFNRLYSMSSEKLIELGDVKIYGAGEDGLDPYDLAGSIINMLKVPFKIPDEVLTDSADIKMGEEFTGVEAPLITTDSIKIQLGEIDLTDLDGGSFDYLENKYELFLPFLTDVVDLIPSLIVGKVISVEYVLDVYSGDVTVNVYNGGDEEIQSIKSSVGRSIPYRIHHDSSTSVGGTNGASNDLKNIYIRRSRPELMQGMFNNLVLQSGILEDQRGFVQVEHMMLKTRANLDEQMQVLNSLQQGVIINNESSVDVPVAGSRFYDFVNEIYMIDGVHVPESAMGVSFSRASKAWGFVGGKLVEYGVDEARVSSEGLLLEPEVTNGFINNTNFTVGSPNLMSVEPYVDGTFEGLHLTCTTPWEGYSNILNTYPLGNFAGSARLLKGLIVKKGLSRYVSLRTATGPVGITLDTVTGEVVGVAEGRGEYDSTFTIVDKGSYFELFIGINGLGASSKQLLVSYGSSRPDNGFDVIAEAGDECIISYLFMSKTELEYSTPIITEDTPVTREVEILRCLVPDGKSVTFDGDDGISFIVENGEAIFNSTKSAQFRSFRVE